MSWNLWTILFRLGRYEPSQFHVLFEHRGSVNVKLGIVQVKLHLPSKSTSMWCVVELCVPSHGSNLNICYKFFSYSFMCLLIDTTTIQDFLTVFLACVLCWTSASQRFFVLCFTFFSTFNLIYKSSKLLYKFYFSPCLN